LLVEPLPKVFSQLTQNYAPSKAQLYFANTVLVAEGKPRPVSLCGLKTKATSEVADKHTHRPVSKTDLSQMTSLTPEHTDFHLG